MAYYNIRSSHKVLNSCHIQKPLCVSEGEKLSLLFFQRRNFVRNPQQWQRKQIVKIHTISHPSLLLSQKQFKQRQQLYLSFSKQHLYHSPYKKNSTDFYNQVSIRSYSSFNKESGKKGDHEDDKNMDNLESQNMFISKPPNQPSVLKNIIKGTVSLLFRLPAMIGSLFIWTSRKIASAIHAVIENPKLVLESPKKAWDFIKHEVQHYWSCTKLLMADIAYAFRTFRTKITRGKALTRRERQQLERTIADIFRLVPFAIIILIPFMEFALPIFLKLFPNMLPSQFDNNLNANEKIKNSVRARLELAKFLQDTVELMANDLKKSDSKGTAANALQLAEFIKKIRNGEMVNANEIKNFAKLFNDEITLDNLPRAQLVAMCKYMGLPRYGTDSYLRYRMRSKLRKLKADDRLIYWEGVNSLSMEELMLACQERGMKVGLPKQELRKQLKEWIELSLEANVPSSLLILSRALMYTDKLEQTEEALKLALGTFSNDIIEEVGLSLETLDTNDSSVFEKKLESLKRQEKLIMEEEMEHRKKIEEQKKKSEEQWAKIQEQRAKAAKHEEISEEEMEEVIEKPKAQAEINEKELEKVEEELKKVIAIMAYASSMTNERVELDDLKDKHNIVIGLSKDIQKEPALNRLTAKVANMLQKVGVSIDEADRRIGTGLNLLDQDRDGVISIEEIQHAAEILKQKPSQDVIRDIISRLDHDGDGKVLVQELMLELKESLMKNRYEDEEQTSATTSDTQKKDEEQKV